MRGPNVREIHTDLPTLHADAACRDSDPDVFFPDDEAPTYEVLVDVARDICSRCHVLDLCRAHGIEYEEFGIWGGMTEQERRKERKRNDITDQN